MSPLLSVSSLIFSSIIVTIVSADYTYWRFGDGNFTNTVPQNHTLFETGLFSDTPTYSYKPIINQTYFYPLITETNEIFIISNHSIKHHMDDSTLSLTKLNGHLNETLATLTLKTGEYSSIPLACSYPVYTKKGDNEYIILNVAQRNGTDSNPRAHLLIINATSMTFLSNIVTSQEFSIEMPRSGSQYPYMPMNVVIYDDYIIQQLKVFQFNQPLAFINYTVFNFQGELLWSYYHEYSPYSDEIFAYTMSPIGINDKIIISKVNMKTYGTLINIEFIAFNASNGWIFWHTVYQNLSYTEPIFIIQPVVHHLYNILLTVNSDNSGDAGNVTAIDIENGNVIGRIKYQITGWTFKPYLCLSIDEMDDILTLTVLNNGATNSGADCVWTYFETWKLKMTTEGRVAFESIGKIERHCVAAPTKNWVIQIGWNHPKCYFADQNGMSLIGSLWFYDDRQGAWGPYASMYSMLSRDGNALGDGKGSMVDNQYGGYDYYGRYPGVGSNGLMYFAGKNAVYAYSMGMKSNNKNHDWVYILAGCAGFVVCVVICVVVLRKRAKRKRGENESLVQNK